MALNGMLWFEDFAMGMPEDVLLRERASHHSHGTAKVHELVDEAGFSLFCSGLARLLARRALLSALVERWWDTTNSFHFSSTGEMTMTPYDFSMITGLRVGGDSIPFGLDMGSHLETQAEIEQYTRGFLIYLLGTTLFVNKWNTVGLYVLSALVVLARVRFYD
ncbi:hypothetical protein ACSBR2_039965 [Camellia fascicularis]